MERIVRFGLGFARKDLDSSIGAGAEFPRRRWGHGPSTVGRVSGRRMHVHKAKADVVRVQLVG